MKNNNALSSNLAGKNNTLHRASCITIYVGGKSGGHIIPALTLAQREKMKHPYVRIVCITTATQTDHDSTASADWIDRVVRIDLMTLSGPRTQRLRSAWQALCALFTSFKVLHQERATRVVSTGGYLSIPVCLAARCLRIPVELYELNARPGKAARFLARLATKIYVCFPCAVSRFHSPASYTPYPVRFTLADREQPTAVRQDKKTILILGGSQGSTFLNTCVGRWLEQHPTLHPTIRIIHQIGINDQTDWQQWYAQRAIEATVFTFSSAMATYYATADLVVCRAGAGTLFETVFFNKKCLVIPLLTNTTTHQQDNAYALAQMYPQLVCVLDQNAVQHNPSLFAASIAPLFKT